MPPKKPAALDEPTRAAIAQYLPEAIGGAMNTYRDFTKGPNLVDAKTFAAYHGACKAAIMHVALLLKLGAMIGPAHGDDGGLALLMADAQADVAEYENAYGAGDHA